MGMSTWSHFSEFFFFLSAVATTTTGEGRDGSEVEGRRNVPHSSSAFSRLASPPWKVRETDEGTAMANFVAFNSVPRRTVPEEW